MAAQLYDEILFDSATFADSRGDGPFIMVMATDISTGSRVGVRATVVRRHLLGPVARCRLSRAAATSSAVPLVLSPVTFNNYGGTCGYKFPAWLVAVADPDNPARPAARAIKRMEEMASFAGRQGPALPAPGRRRPRRQPRHARGARSAGGVRGGADARHQDAARQRQAHRRRRRQFAVGARRPTGTSRSGRPAVSRSCSRRPACRSTATRPRPSSCCAT